MAADKEHGHPPGLPSLSPGTVIGGDFMVVRPLKTGAMGAVYVVEQLSTAVHRALKVLRVEYTSDDTLYRRFEREAQVGAKIASEHVAQVVAAGVDAKLKLPWIAMELLEGQDLRDHVEEHGHLAPHAVRQLFEQLCHALGAAHAAGIVHRDLKPANVFLSAARRVGARVTVKVLDFGIARIVAERLTLTGTPMGTPLWMAPEQTVSQPAVPATDVWALGLLGFYVLTGQHYWRSAKLGGDLAATMAEMYGGPLALASVRARELGLEGRIPKDFDAWFSLCVAISPTERFVNAHAAFTALERCLPAGR